MLCTVLGSYGSMVLSGYITFRQIFLFKKIFNIAESLNSQWEAFIT